MGSAARRGPAPDRRLRRGRGALCLDLGARTAEGDAPVVWIEHEALFELGEPAWGDRAAVARLARPLYPSFEALLDDVVGAA